MRRLSSLALLCLYSERAPGESGLLVLAGFMAGCAGWTKNEGLLFISALLCIGFAFANNRERSIIQNRITFGYPINK